MFRDLLTLFYPNLCAACLQPLVKNENAICLPCKLSLPKTDFHRFKDNPVHQLFWGRVPLESATSLYFFNKGAKVQRMMHQLKYKGNTVVGEALGRELGHSIKSSDMRQKIDVVIPVPLHPRKEKTRGYNQSQLIAKGVAESLEIKSSSHLYRKFNGKSQTKKSRYDRWKNVETMFGVRQLSELKGKHVLLVDDVVTTGATLESCVKELLKADGIKVSIATIACTQ